MMESSRNKIIFSAFEKIEDWEEGPASTAMDESRFYSDENPFDFFRKAGDDKQYIPKTQTGLRKAFAEGITGIEYFLVMATSLRPFIDEAQDIDEITRLFSQQKLASRPNLHSVKIFRNMIKDPNPEIALYAAEGLNAIENNFINKIQRIKKKLAEGKGKAYILNYLLGKLYLEFSRLLVGQDLIMDFYLKEAFHFIKESYLENKNCRRTKKILGEVLLCLKEYEKAISVFANLFSLNRYDIDSLFLMAECYYDLKNYLKVFEICKFISGITQGFDEQKESAVYQWIL